MLLKVFRMNGGLFAQAARQAAFPLLQSARDEFLPRSQESALASHATRRARRGASTNQLTIVAKSLSRVLQQPRSRDQPCSLLQLRFRPSPTSRPSSNDLSVVIA